MRCVTAGYIDNHWKLSKSTPIFCEILLKSEKQGQYAMCKCGVD